MGTCERVWVGLYRIGINAVAQCGFFECYDLSHPAHGEVFFKNGRVVKVEGVDSLPRTVSDFLRQKGYEIN